jgi:outer membrane lipoprotein-sorting protein
MLGVLSVPVESQLAIVKRSECAAGSLPFAPAVTSDCLASSGARCAKVSSVKYVRTVSTRRLLSLIAGVIGVIVVGTAIAVAAIGSGPVPRREPLAVAIRQALKAPAITGISARITFTNSLIDATNFQGPTDPLLQGATGRLWMTDTAGNHQLRIELQSDNGDAQVVYDNGRFSIYDPAQNVAYEGSVPASKPATVHRTATTRVPSIAAITRALTRVSKHAQVSGAIPSDVGGQAAYTVRISPQSGGGLLGGFELAWDAIRGVPLRFAIYAKGDSSPVLQIEATDISYGPVAASVFNVSPPPGTRVQRISTATTSHGSAALPRRRYVYRLPSSLVAPASLDGMARASVHRLGRDGALALYGHGLSGVAVLEQPVHGSQSDTSSSRGGLSIPTVSINGVTGQQLQTALGTVVRFTRGRVAYTVIGSVTPATADAVARGL